MAHWYWASGSGSSRRGARYTLLLGAPAAVAGSGVCKRSFEVSVWAGTFPVFGNVKLWRVNSVGCKEWSDGTARVRTEPQALFVYRGFRSCKSSAEVPCKSSGSPLPYGALKFWEGPLKIKSNQLLVKIFVKIFSFCWSLRTIFGIMLRFTPKSQKNKRLSCFLHFLSPWFAAF